jgi:hypothetical protein
MFRTLLRLKLILSGRTEKYGLLKTESRSQMSRKVIGFIDLMAVFGDNELAIIKQTYPRFLIGERSIDRYMILSSRYQRV